MDNWLGMGMTVGEQKQHNMVRRNVQEFMNYFMPAF
jgi:hypothetical protein